MRGVASVFTALLALWGAAAATPASAAFTVPNGVCETTTTTGTGTLNLAGAYTSPIQWLAFSTQLSSGDTVPYTIESSDGKFEHGIGTWTDAAPDTLARTTVKWSSDGAATALNLPAGTHIVCAQIGSETLYDGLLTLDLNTLDFDNTTDTTITRDSAGRVDIEGIPVNKHVDSATEPTSPKAGDGWYDYDSGAFVKELCDADSCQWVEVGVGASTTNRTPGEFFWWSVSGTCPSYSIPANGASLSRTTYANLWAQVSAVATNSTASDADWDDGDGSTTFAPPDLESDNLLVRAADGTTIDVGDEQASGAPDIDASMIFGVNLTGGTGALSQSGSAFSNAAGGSGNYIVTFAASADDPIYSDSVSEIRPPNAAFQPCIVF